MLNKPYNIIRFTGQNRRYYGDSIVTAEAVLTGNLYVTLCQMDILLRQSR